MGENSFGQLGNSTNSGTRDPNPTPLLVSGGLSFAAVAIAAGGARSTCALTTAGAAYCWGLNISGQLGTSTNSGTLTPNPAPLAVSGGLTFVSIGTGPGHACALTGSGAAYCWGNNRAGALGVATNVGTDDATPPSLVSGGLTFTALKAGGVTCGLVATGAAYCWGTNLYGMLGTTTNSGTTDPNPAPLPVDGNLAFVGLSAGGFESCGLTSAGAAFCWGNNFGGGLGTTTNNGTNDPNPSPAAVSGNVVFATP